VWHGIVLVGAIWLIVQVDIRINLKYV